MISIAKPPADQCIPGMACLEAKLHASGVLMRCLRLVLFLATTELPHVLSTLLGTARKVEEAMHISSDVKSGHECCI